MSIRAWIAGGLAGMVSGVCLVPLMISRSLMAGYVPWLNYFVDKLYPFSSLLCAIAAMTGCLSIAIVRPEYRSRIIIGISISLVFTFLGSIPSFLDIYSPCVSYVLGRVVFSGVGFALGALIGIKQKMPIGKREPLIIQKKPMILSFWFMVTILFISVLLFYIANEILTISSKSGNMIYYAIFRCVTIFSHMFFWFYLAIMVTRLCEWSLYCRGLEQGMVGPASRNDRDTRDGKDGEN